MLRHSEAGGTRCQTNGFAPTAYSWDGGYLVNESLIKPSGYEGFIEEDGMEQQIFVAGFIGFFSVLGITLPIYRAYLVEKKENDSWKEKERFERYCRKRDANSNGLKCSPPSYDDENLGHMVRERSQIGDADKWKNSLVRPDKFTNIADRVKWDLENQTTDQLRAQFREGKEISKRISEEYDKLIKEWEEMAASCKHPASHDTDQNHQ